MPKRRAEDTPGMVMTDHLIQRRQPVNDLPAKFRERPPEKYHGEVVPYYPSPLPPTPDNALYRAVAQVGLHNNLDTGLLALAREIATQKPREPEFYLVLGDGLQAAGKHRESVAAYEEAVKLAPNSPRVLRLLAAGLSADGQLPRASEMLNRALELAPADPITWYRCGMLDSLSGRLEDAAQKIGKAIELDPSLPDQSTSLADVLARSGESDRAQAALRDALRIDPYDDAAWDLAGRVLTEKGEMAEAFYNFEKALRLRPGYAPYLYDFALALVRGDRFDEAQQRAEEAVRADPNLADAHELLGSLFAQKAPVARGGPRLPAVPSRCGQIQAARTSGSATCSLHKATLPARRNTGVLAARGGDAAIAQQATHALRRIGAR